MARAIAIAKSCLLLLSISLVCAGLIHETGFQASRHLFTGSTPTGQTALFAQPTQTSTYHLHGQLSHYFPNPTGFGVDELPLPDGANITKLFMLSRHGARYPTETSKFVKKIVENAGKYTASGRLSFLNEWTNKLGEEVLVPLGKQELFDSGTLHQTQYGHLYSNTVTKILARSTTQSRMTESAEYFLAGFFGLRWSENATLERIIEGEGFNNSLAGYFNCPNANRGVSFGGTNASVQWQEVYLADAARRLVPLVKSDAFEITLGDVHDMQSLCALETVALGHSQFCDLFTYEEWEGYEYSVDLTFAGENGFQSPTGRAVGIGWAQELLARLTHHYITSPAGTQVNTTLDSMPSTFPLDQALNFDFSHDTNIFSILVALGLTQFATFLPVDHIVAREAIVSHVTPFGARLDIEVITTPAPLKTDNCMKYETAKGGETLYIHFVLNQRTIPLGRSYEQCGDLKNGWCEMGAFLDATKDIVEESQYEYACFGDYEAVPYGMIENGVPQPRS